MSIINRVSNSPNNVVFRGAEPFSPLCDQYPSEAIRLLSQAIGKLNIFFSRDNISQIENCFETRNVQTLRSTFREIVGGRNVQELSKIFSQTPYKDLESILAQAVKQIQSEKKGLLHYKDKEEHWFLGKGLQCTDPKTGMCYKGIITLCKIEQKQIICEIDCKERLEIDLKDHLKPLVKVIEKETMIFHKLFERPLFSLTNFELSYKPGFEGEIPVGHYYIKEETKATKNHRIWRLAKDKKLLKADQYKIDLKYRQNQHNKVVPSELTLSQLKDGKQTSKNKLDRYQFIHNCLLTSKTPREAIGINAGNINDCITINLNPDEHAIKLKHLITIQKKTDELRTFFFRKENAPFLSSLFNGIVYLHSTSLYGIVQKHSPGGLCKTVEMIAKEYQEGLGQEKSPDEIIREVALEVNYQKLVSKDRNIEVAKTLHLIQEADKHIQPLEGKDAVLFMGKTGAGKSAAVCYLLGAKMDHFTNNVGDPVVRLSEGEDLGKYPKIGQSLGQSETLYTTAFKLNDATYNPDGSVMFCDCPGFDDNRGGSYELCSNLSIDSIPRLAKRIRSVVVTLPANAFLSERANAVIDTIETVKERFPFAFGINDTKDKKRVYILITKGQQVPHNTLTAIGDGTRVRELLQEANEALEAERNKQSGINLIMQTVMAKRQLIWRSLSEMYANKQVDVVDMQDCFEKEQLLKKYVAKDFSIDKSRYVKAMEGRDMQIKFGKNLEMATDSWAFHIIRPYMEEFPAKINEYKKIIEGKGKSLEELENELQKHEEEVKAANDEFESLSEGVRKETLWKTDYRGKEDKKAKIGESVSEDTIRKSFKKGIPLPASKDSECTILSKWSEYKGRLVHLAYVDKSFRLVPKDEEQAKRFVEQFKRCQGFSSSAEFESKADGELFEFTLGMQHYNDRRKIGYAFETIWNGDGKMPWIEIFHTIPNSIRNEAQLINIRAKVVQLQKKIAEIKAQKSIEEEKDIDGAKEQLKGCKIKKRHLALAISKEWESAELLYRFMKTIFLNSTELTKAHKGFIEVFDKHKDAIKLECENDLEEWRKELRAPMEVDEGSSLSSKISGNNKRELDDPSNSKTKRQNKRR